MKYFAQEVVAADNFEIEADTVTEILSQIKAKIIMFLDENPDSHWINVGFSNDGETDSNITIGRK